MTNEELKRRVRMIDPPIPVDFRDQMLDWPQLRRSPYSSSYYSIKNKGWGSTPIGAMRVSDHWNYTMAREHNSCVHSRTDIEIPEGQWAIGTWDGEQYIISDILPPATKVEHNNYTQQPRHR